MDIEYKQLIYQVNLDIWDLIKLINAQGSYLVEDEFYNSRLREQLLYTAKIILLSYGFKILECNCIGPNDDGFFHVIYKIKTEKGIILESSKLLEEF